MPFSNTLHMTVLQFLSFSLLSSLMTGSYILLHIIMKSLYIQEIFLVNYWHKLPTELTFICLHLQLVKKRTPNTIERQKFLSLIHTNANVPFENLFQLGEIMWSSNTQVSWCVQGFWWNYMQHHHLTTSEGVWKYMANFYLWKHATSIIKQGPYISIL